MKGGWGREDKNYYNDGITFILMRNSSTFLEMLEKLYHTLLEVLYSIIYSYTTLHNY